MISKMVGAARMCVHERERERELEVSAKHPLGPQVESSMHGDQNMG